MVIGVVLPLRPLVIYIAFIIFGAWGSAIPLLVDFSSSVAYSRSRAFRKSISAQDENICASTHSGGFELTKLRSILPGSRR